MSQDGTKYRKTSRARHLLLLSNLLSSANFAFRTATETAILVWAVEFHRQQMDSLSIFAPSFCVQKVQLQCIFFCKKALTHSVLLLVPSCSFTSLIECYPGNASIFFNWFCTSSTSWNAFSICYLLLRFTLPPYWVTFSIPSTHQVFACFVLA